MTTTTPLELFAAGFVLAALIGAWLSYRYAATAARNARATGYSEGHLDATNSSLQHIQQLTRRVTSLNAALESLQAKATDLDQRAEHLAARSNPFTAADHSSLNAIAKKLELAASTFAGIHAGDHARQASQLRDQALEMATRLEHVILRGQPAPTSSSTEQEAAA